MPGRQPGIAGDFPDIRKCTGGMPLLVWWLSPQNGAFFPTFSQGAQISSEVGGCEHSRKLWSFHEALLDRVLDL